MERFVKGDFIMLQITSKNVRDSYAISLLSTDFVFGSLKQDSNVRPNKIFTLNRQLILYKIGRLNEEKIEECVRKVCDIVQND